LLGRGQARAERGKFQAALEDYTWALALAPDAQAYAARGWLYLLTDSARLARADFEEALRGDPNGDAYNGRGLARVKLGDVRGAVADAEEALRHGPEGTRMLYNAARIYAQASAAVTPARLRGGPDRDVGLRYREQAVNCLRRAVGTLPASEHPPFWHDRVSKDAAFAPLAGHPELTRLATACTKSSL
jgi:tetratricopeptide (TPR) repeat protein